MLSILIDNYFILVLMFGFILLFRNDMNIDKNKGRRIKELFIVITCMTIGNAMRNYYDSLNYYSISRTISYYLCYILRPAAMILFMSILSNNKYIKYFSFLTFLNTIIYSTCFFSDIAFTISSTNEIIRGPLAYTSHILCFLYFILFILIIIKQYNPQNKQRTYVLCFIAISCLVASLLDITLVRDNLFDYVILMCGLNYYLYIYMESNKIDVLTNTFNRTTFYKDIKQIGNNVTSVISIDMNNLKTINDTLGHNEGDIAISTIAKILLDVDKKYVRIYRVGGDEFVALCFYKDKTKVDNYISEVKNRLSKTKYTCSFGYAYKSLEDDVFDVYKNADNEMYLEKEAYHKKHGRSR